MAVIWSGCKKWLRRLSAVGQWYRIDSVRVRWSGLAVAISWFALRRRSCSGGWRTTCRPDGNDWVFSGVGRMWHRGTRGFPGFGSGRSIAPGVASHGRKRSGTHRVLWCFRSGGLMHRNPACRDMNYCRNRRRYWFAGDRECRTNRGQTTVSGLF